MDNIEYDNTVVIDLECIRSSEDCRHCYKPQNEHEGDLYCEAGTQYVAIGWNNRPLLGLSIGMLYDYQMKRMVPFDATCIESLFMAWMKDQPFLVGFNSSDFDLVLMRGLLRREADALRLHKPPYVPGELETPAQMTEFATAEAFGRYQQLTGLCDRVKAYCQGPRCWDLLQAVWLASPETKRVRGLNGLDAIAQANGLGATVESGALMPAYWRAGKYAAVIQHCIDDVRRTVLLFEMALRGEPLKRLDGSTVRLRVPAELQQWWNERQVLRRQPLEQRV